MVETTTERERWLDERDQGIGASEVSTLLGLNPWETELQLWARKTGKVPRLKESEAMRIGLVIENTIAELFRQETGRIITDPGPYIIQRNPDFPLLGCTLDRTQDWHSSEIALVPSFVTHPWPGTLQLKNVGWRVASHWVNEDGDQVVPDYTDAQCQAEMHASQMEWGSAAALIGGNQFRWADIDRKRGAWFDDLKEAIDRFWRNHVQADIPPEATSKDAAILKHLYPRHEPDTVVSLPITANYMADDLRRLKLLVKDNEAEIEGIHAKVKGMIGTAERGVAPDGTFWTWRASERKQYTVAAKSVRTFRMTDPK